MSKNKLFLQVVEDVQALADSLQELAVAMQTYQAEPQVEAPEPPVETKPEVKQPTLEEVRAAMADKSRDGHREVVKAIITKYGANNLSSLDPKHYAAALKEVGELK